MNVVVKSFAAFALLIMAICFSPVVIYSQSKPVYQLPPAVSMAADMIKDDRFDEAIKRLEQFLNTTPNDPEALTMLAAARMYKEKDFYKAKTYFEDAMKQGGGASFFVGHSHEMTKMSVGDPSDYCSGWLHLRKGQIAFVPERSSHELKLTPSEIEEFAQNRMGKLFHIKASKGKDGKDRNFNFAPRSRAEAETLLVVAMYKKFPQK